MNSIQALNAAVASLTAAADNSACGAVASCLGRLRDYLENTIRRGIETDNFDLIGINDSIRELAAYCDTFDPLTDWVIPVSESNGCYAILGNTVTPGLPVDQWSDCPYTTICTLQRVLPRGTATQNRMIVIKRLLILLAREVNYAD